jgi:hypothetical protein
MPQAFFCTQGVDLDGDTAGSMLRPSPPLQESSDLVSIAEPVQTFADHPGANPVKTRNVPVTGALPIPLL